MSDEVAVYDEAKGLWYIPCIGRYFETEQEAIEDYFGIEL